MKPPQIGKEEDDHINGATKENRGKQEKKGGVVNQWSARKRRFHQKDGDVEAFKRPPCHGPLPGLLADFWIVAVHRSFRCYKDI